MDSQYPKIRVDEAAFKHGFGEDDILHAYRNPLWVWPGDDGFVMIVGVSWSAGLLEIGIIERDDGDLVIHAMTARRKYWR